MKRVRYPYALDTQGQLIQVADHVPGEAVTCIECGGAMVARRGTKRRGHFAHASATATCNGEGWLHRTAKLLIERGYRAARERGRPYLLRWRCPSCRTERDTDATQWSEEVRLEEVITVGTRSDVAFVGGSRPVAVEIVVTHAPDTATLVAYAEAGVRVFTVKPTPETLGALESEILADATHNLDTARCTGCRVQRELHEARERRRAAAKSEVERLIAELRSRRRNKRVELATWRFDRRGNEVRPYLAHRLFRTAAKLLEAGFTQSSAKPFLFYVRLADDVGTFFAYLGGTDVIPIWEDSRPLVYLKEKNCPTDVRDMLLRGLVEYGDWIGVPMRMSFYEAARWDSDE